MRTSAMQWCQRTVLAMAVVLSPALTSAQPGIAALSTTVTDSPDPVVAGANLTYTITVTNNGPDPASAASLSDPLPVGTTFVSLSSPADWLCMLPAVGAGGTVSCSIASLAVGSAIFTLTVAVDIATANGTMLSNTATAGSTTIDPDPGNESDTEMTTVTGVPLTPIHDIQGPGASSPIVGATITVRGIVTGVKTDGFFVQEEDAEVDADPASSEGIFVFTSGAPPVAAAFTAQVMVSGTVAENVPSADPQQPPSTQLVSPTTFQTAAPGQPLPAAVPLTPTFPDPAGPFDQLERVEHMRVSAASITVSGPSEGSVNEAAATGTSNGRFYGVVTGLARPFREAGIRSPDVPPAGTIPPIPRWDANPERLRIDSAAINGQPILTVKSGDVVAPLVGPLDYTLRVYTILADGTAGTPVITPGSLPATVSVPQANELTVASFNLQRFFDTVNDPSIGEPVLTALAYANRLAKASVAIRDHLRSPDIIGVQDVENLSTLSDLATSIAADGGPNYAPFLVEGNDTAGLDVGFLVKMDVVPGGQPRVEVESVTQIGLATTWIDPSTNVPVLLNDRPPLVLKATVNRTSTASFPIVVIVTHLQSLIGIDSSAPDGLTTEGDRVRQKRQAQAEFLANSVQERVTADSAEHLVVVGDFNAFAANDGYVDVMNVIAGTPPPDNQTVVPGDGVDLVNPDLVNLANTPPAAERYSRVEIGDAASLDHVLVSQGLIAGTSARRIEYPRIGADYPETERNNNATAFRLSDHDPVVAYFATDALSITAPTITDIPNQTVLEDTATAALPFVIDDAETPAASLTLSGSSSDTAIVPDANIVFGGSGANRTVTVTPLPDQHGGPVTITVTASDGSLSAADTFTVRVNAANDLPTITNIADQTIAEDTSTGALPFTIADADGVGTLSVSASSSNATIVSDANLVIGGTGASRTLTVTPAANQHGGPVTIMVTVSDGTTSASDTFSLTVTTDDEPPTLTGVVDATVEETKTVTQTLTVSDDDSAVEALTVTATSSNDALLPDSSAIVTGTGATRTLTLTPIPEQTGETLIMVTVDDGGQTTTRTARLIVTVAPPPDPPTGLTGTVAGNVITFTWTAPAAGATPTFYVLEGGVSPGGTTLPVINTSSPETQWSVTLPVGAYQFRVRAANRAGTSDGSNEAPIAIGAPAPLPGPPTALVADVTGALVAAQWAPATVGGAPDLWQIELGSTPGARDRGVFHVPSRFTAAQGSLAAGEYLLRIRGVNAAGEGPPSNEVRLRVGALPACEPPEAPVLLPATVVGRLVALTWRGSRNTAIASYRVLVGSQPGANDLYAFDTGPVNAFAALAPPLQYFVSVVAMNDCGSSQPSNTIRVDVGPGPPAPLNLRAVVDGARVTIAWDAAAGVDGYVFEAGTAPGVINIAFIPTGAPGFVASGVAPGTYYARVRAVRAGLISGPSGEIAVVVVP